MALGYAEHAMVPLFSTDSLPHDVGVEQSEVEHGEVFTRRWVVNLVLDLAGYTADRDLADLRLVEPACGSGAFLEAVAERLVASATAHGRALGDLAGCVRAYDLLPEHVAAARDRVSATLVGVGLSPQAATRTAAVWVAQEDYLLADFAPETVDVVVGNPPYVRLEDVPAGRSAVYRRRWPTMGGRADLFIGFIERGLRSLRPGGSLGFICADRWMRNQYGRGLRELIADRFSMDVVVSMHDVDAFEDAVSAYPAVTVISNRAQGPVIVADTTAAFGAPHASEVVAFCDDPGSADSDGNQSGRTSQEVVVLPRARPFTVTRLPHWFTGGESWPQGSPERLAMIEHLSDHFAPLQDPATGTKVGIGVATGADKVFIVDGRVDVEDDRLLPMAMVRDLATGELKWSGHYLVSPWQEDGLVDLGEYPRLAAYYDRHGEALRGRYVARDGRGWYRTIDRVDVHLTDQPKLLVPDMRMSIHPVLDTGGTYPHHNLYHVTSRDWDLRVLGGLLLSGVSNAFVEAYAVKMRGGTLRFQAQYLRRIRVPHLSAVSAQDARELGLAFDRRDVAVATAVALRLYGLDDLPE